MKICFVCNEYPPLPGGGIGIFVQTIAEALIRLGLDVTVVGFGKKVRRPYKLNGVSIHWLTLPDLLYRKIQIGGFPYSLASLIKRHYLSLYLYRLTQLEKFDLVESYDFSGPLAIKPPTKLVVRLHGSVVAYRLGEGRPRNIHPVDRYYEIRQLEMADHIVAVSQHIGELTEKALGRKLAFQVLQNGVQISFFCPQPGMEDDMILFVGNVMWRKGIFDLIKALPMVMEKHPAVCLKIVGGVGGVHQKQLTDTLAEIPEAARHHVELLGQIARDDLPALYNRARVFVFSSRVEAFGLTCIEAMACARPVVASRLASGPELVEDGVSGLLADPTKPADLAEKITILLDNPVWAKKLGLNARQRVLERFDLNQLGQRNLDYYQSVLQSGG